MPADPKTDKVPDETLTSSHGPQAPARDKRPERNYPEAERRTGANRTDEAAPKGPVNIGVKGGGAGPAGPDAAAQETPQATGRGSRDAPSLPRE